MHFSCILICPSKLRIHKSLRGAGSRYTCDLSYPP